MNRRHQNRARDGQRRHKDRGPELFGIVRDVDQEASVAFLGLAREIPRISDKIISNGQIKEPIGLKIVNRGLIRSIIVPVFREGRIEQKEINRMSGDLIQSMNGRGTDTVTIGPHDLVPCTIPNGNNTGTFKISEKSDVFEYLNDANEYARDKLVEWTGSNSGRAALEPRIDLYTTLDKDAGSATVKRVAEIMREEGVPIVLEEATVYEMPR